MPQLEHIEAIEKQLWSTADNLRANSNYVSNEYFLSVIKKGTYSKTGLKKVPDLFSRYGTG